MAAESAPFPIEQLRLWAFELVCQPGEVARRGLDAMLDDAECLTQWIAHGLQPDARRFNAMQERLLRRLDERGAGSEES